MTKASKATLVKEINVCPFRIYTKTYPAVLKGQTDTTVYDFMECLKSGCPAYYTNTVTLPNGEVAQASEHCKRLE